MGKKQIGSVRSPLDLVREYDEKLADLQSLYDQLNAAADAVERGCVVAGSFGRGRLWSEKPRLYIQDMEANLLRSAWWAAYEWCNMEVLATAKDKQAIEAAFQEPVPFTEGNLVQTFGPYLADQRGAILRGLAEAFILLDDAYKSHSKVKIGVKGLPKRVIINNAAYTWGRAWGWEKMHDMLNALHVFNGHGLIPRDIISDIQNQTLLKFHGMEFRWFQNGNVHIHFDQDACRQINLGLAEFYGDVLPDVEVDNSEIKPDAKKTDVSKDLQYYPTPKAVVDKVLNRVSLYKVNKVLEPSCGCGRIMDGLHEMAQANRREQTRYNSTSAPAMPIIQGMEYSRERADEARAKGHRVVCVNFLEQIPTGDYDLIVMNPPFYGKHYLKHIEHAMKFLRDGGTLVSILPATAHYDHKKLPKGYQWTDLPVGAFAESGTRVPTGFMEWSK